LKKSNQQNRTQLTRTTDPLRTRNLVRPLLVLIIGEATGTPRPTPLQPRKPNRWLWLVLHIIW